MSEKENKPSESSTALLFARRGCLWALAAAWALAALVVGVLVLVAQLDLDALLRSQNTIHIAVQSPLSGEQAPLGQAIGDGAILAVEREAGALQEMGYQVVIVPFDDQADPEVGVDNAIRIVWDRDVLAVIGHLNSAVALPASRVYAEAELALISPANTNPMLTVQGLPTVNRVCGRDDHQGIAAARYAYQRLGVQSVYVLYEETPYGRGIAAKFRAEAERTGMSVLGYQGAPPDAALAVTESISQTQPQLVYFAGLYLQAGPVFQELYAAGLDQLIFMGPDGLDSIELASLAPDARGRIYYSRVVGPADAYSRAEEVRLAYQERFGRSAAPYALQAYDATVVALRAIEAAVRAAGAKPSRAAVSQAVRDVGPLAGCTGRLDFDRWGNLREAEYFFFGIAEEGATWDDNPVAGSVWVGSGE